MPEEDAAPIKAVTSKNYETYLEERKLLIDAARESARTFDKAILTFASAAFGFSIAFLKEAAPHPARETLFWLKFSWGCFSFSLLAIMLSFLFSHEACRCDIARAFVQLVKEQPPKRNLWSHATTVLNYFAIILVFLGITLWGMFVFANLNASEDHTPMGQKTGFEKGYVPPPPPQRNPQPQQTTEKAPDRPPPQEKK